MLSLPLSHMLRPFGAMAGRAASHPQKEALISHLLLSNHKPMRLNGLTFQRQGTWTKDQKEDPDICQTATSGNAPTPSMWNLREDLAEEPPASQADACILLQSPCITCPDSSNVGMSPLQSWAIHAYAWWRVTVIQEFNAN